jgi:hypothetical protein
MPFSHTSWTDITPITLDPHVFPPYGVNCVTTDPQQPNIVFCTIDSEALYKSTDYGNTWTPVGGTPPYANNSGTTTTYFDAPFRIRVDPNNSNNIYLTQGVRGFTLGFWNSTDGGINWSLSSGFQSIATTVGNSRDVTCFDVDPTDFNHIILSSHTPWTGFTSGGILESTDGGATWTAHNPQATWPVGTHGIHFLYDPKSSQGNANTWLCCTAGDGAWKTTNAGTSWTKVSTNDCPHGGNSLYYGSNGQVYYGGQDFPMVSSDNGATWSQVTGIVNNWYYYGIWGDGINLYTSLSFTGDNGGYGGGNQPFLTSLETDGVTWSNFQGGAQTFTDGPYYMHYEPNSGIMYSANWAAGLLALQARDVNLCNMTGITCLVLP